MVTLLPLQLVLPKHVESGNRADNGRPTARFLLAKGFKQKQIDVYSVHQVSVDKLPEIISSAGEFCNHGSSE